MKEVDDLIYQRMIADTGLVALIGSTTRIGYGFQVKADANSPQLVFFQAGGSAGQLVGDFTRTYEYLYQFGIYANNYVDIVSRLKRLFDGHQFTVSGTTEIGSVSSVFDWDGVEGFDENLEVAQKDVRFRFFVVPKAQDPI